MSPDFLIELFQKIDSFFFTEGPQDTKILKSRQIIIFLRVLCVLYASVRGLLKRIPVLNHSFSGLKKVNAVALRKNRRHIPIRPEATESRRQRQKAQ